jgi:hypothetical protein
MHLRENGTLKCVCLGVQVAGVLSCFGIIQTLLLFWWYDILPQIPPLLLFFALLCASSLFTVLGCIAGGVLALFRCRGCRRGRPSAGASKCLPGKGSGVNS